jgi:hypothetical protein
MTRVNNRESFSPGVFLPGEKVAKPDEGEFARISPHPHFVSPSPRKNPRGEGLSITTYPR